MQCILYQSVYNLNLFDIHGICMVYVMHFTRICFLYANIDLPCPCKHIPCQTQCGRCCGWPLRRTEYKHLYSMYVQLIYVLYTKYILCKYNTYQWYILFIYYLYVQYICMVYTTRPDSAWYSTSASLDIWLMTLSNTACVSGISKSASS